jgi:DNA-directed RNA polymerase beta subunit
MINIEVLEKIADLHISPDLEQGIEYFPLHCMYKNFTDTLKNIEYYYKKDKIVCFQQEVRNGLEKYIIEFENFRYEKPLDSFNDCSYLLKPYELAVHFDVILKRNLYRLEKNDELISSTIILTNRDNNNKFTIPIFLNYGNDYYDRPLSLKRRPEIGGFICTNKGIHRQPLNIVLKEINFPKYRRDQKKQTFYFTSKTINATVDKNHTQFLVLHHNLESSIDESVIVIKSKNTIDMNAIAFVKYVTSWSYEMILSYINKIQVKSSSKLLAELLIEYTKFLYPNEASLKAYALEKITLQASPKSEKNGEIIFWNKFLPHIPSTDKMQKAIFILNNIREFILHMYLPELLPNKDSTQGIRHFSYGSAIESLVLNAKAKQVRYFKDKFIEFSGSDQLKNIPNTDLKIEKSDIRPMINDYITKGKIASKGLVATSLLRQNISFAYDLSKIRSSIKMFKLAENLTRHLAAREYNQSYAGILCPITFNDSGANSGLTTEMAAITHISSCTIEDELFLFDQLFNFINNFNEDNKFNYKYGGTIVKILCYQDTYIKPKLEVKFIESLRYLRRHNYFIYNDFGVVLDFLPTENDGYIIKEIRINIDKGRYLRPVFLNPILYQHYNSFKNNYLTLKVNPKHIPHKEITNIETDKIIACKTVSELKRLYPNLIDVVDADELCYRNVCKKLSDFQNETPENKIKYDIIEFPTQYLLSSLANQLLYTTNNVSVRVTTGSMMTKQAVSTIPSPRLLKDNGYSLIQGYRSVVNSSVSYNFEVTNRPSFFPAFVGFMTHGDILEDSIIIRRGFINSGAGALVIIKKLFTKVNSQNFKVKKEPKNKTSYNKLESNGLPAINTILQKGDSLCKNVAEYINYEGFMNNNNNESIGIDKSDKYAEIHPGRVDSIDIVDEDEMKITIMTMSLSYLKVGDKITNRHGHKGTIGFVYEDHEMPYLRNGVRLDIIQNSSNHNSRKTYSGYKESVINEIVIRRPMDNGVYEEYVLNIDKDFIETEKEISNSSSGLGEYTLYNPQTSLPYENKINCFMMNFGRNKHIVENAILVRDVGKVNNITKQPTGGKKTSGGNSTKMSQMELQILLAHGASNILREMSRDVESTDHISYICSKCSQFCIYEKINNEERYYCYTCEKIRGYSEPIGINISYASKSFLMYMQARGIKAEFVFE